MNQFIVGQRWISLTEHDLGLGIIADCEGRHVIISFPAAGERRTYAIDAAPLNRVRFNIGDTVTSSEGLNITITAIAEENGLFVYRGIDSHDKPLALSELELDCFIRFTTPLERLLSGQIDKLSAFTLRMETLRHLHQLDQSSVKGLLGARTSLLPHQVYIANEVGQRHAPRVLLADEVGLGKTIEAGMIIHQQIHSGRAKRILIVVPDSLIHQWLVEMLRRFNLHFSVFDEERFESYEQADSAFDNEQWILCPLSLLTRLPAAAQAACNSQWDLLVVDEAHHLEWTDAGPGIAYQCINDLSACSLGVLLLTATPEQVGMESHFARLRLLDPDRFYDLAAFLEQESHYQQLNTLVEAVQQTDKIETGSTIYQQLCSYLPTDQLNSILVEETDPVTVIIRQLLDRHGTSRVLFRNTRSAIPHFPVRQAMGYPLPCPPVYQTLSAEQGLTPEHFAVTANWLTDDPRVGWLRTFLSEHGVVKVLLICAQAQSAVDLEQFLRLRCGVRSAVFHEGLTLIERDRAAAWFADIEDGAQILLCSEIGSEGRNFQFAHHLVLFDLPLNPDLLEQRIGRLDRIGQTETIKIHVPYFANSPQHILFRWYHEGLQLLEHSCSAGTAIYQHFAATLIDLLSTPDKDPSAFLRDVNQYTIATRERLQNGRDKCLELNSCRMDIAQRLISDIQQMESDDALSHYMQRVFNLFGIDQDYHSPKAWAIRPNEELMSSFPGLTEDGLTITFDRNTALSREDMAFLSWEHPMVDGAMELVQAPDFGSASIATISVKGLTPGTMLMETIFTVECMAPRALQLQRFMPITPIRFLLDPKGKNIAHALSHNALNKLCEKVSLTTAQAIVKQQHREIRHVMTITEQLAEKPLAEIKAGALTRLQHELKAEISRLQALQAVNPHVREEEIEQLRHQLEKGEFYLSQAQLELYAVRVIVTT